MTRLATALVILLLLAGCSGSDVAVAESSGTDADAASSCAASALQIVERFDAFLEPYADMAPDEFLATDLDGLGDFQNDIAETVVGVATDPNDDCTERDLEAEVDAALQDYAGQGTLNQ